MIASNHIIHTHGHTKTPTKPCFQTQMEDFLWYFGHLHLYIRKIKTNIWVIIFTHLYNHWNNTSQNTTTMLFSPMPIYFKLTRFPSSVGTSPVRLLPPMNISEMISMRTLDSRRNKSSTHYNTIYFASI